jgi:hypothetical protein
MREWKVAALRVPCGHSMGCLIQPGEQYCLLKGDGWITAKVRCAAHAGSEPPEISEDRKIAGAVFEERHIAADAAGMVAGLDSACQEGIESAGKVKPEDAGVNRQHAATGMGRVSSEAKQGQNLPSAFSSVKHLAQAAETDWAKLAANDTDED